MDYKPFMRRANFYETDAMGVVHHSNYIRWFEEARIDLMAQAGYPYQKMEQQGIQFIMLSAACEYKNMVRFGDEVQIFVTAKFETAVRIVHEYRVMKGETVCAVGKTTCCAFHTERKRIVSLQKETPEFCKLFE